MNIDAGMGEAGAVITAQGTGADDGIACSAHVVQCTKDTSGMSAGLKKRIGCERRSRDRLLP